MSTPYTKKQFHLCIDENDIGKYVILPGDPGRVEKIAALLDNPQRVAQNREYTTYTGSLNGTAVSVTSTGIGGASAAIAAEELIRCGAHTLIRVGTSGGMKTTVSGGDLVVAAAATRSEGTSHEYLPEAYPAVADFSVVNALYDAAATLSSDEDGKRCHVGVVHSKDSFYGETNPETMPVCSKLNEAWDAFVRCGCLTSEMECAALFAVAAARGIRAGAVLTVLWNAELSKKGVDGLVTFDSGRAIRCATDAIALLIERDRRKGSADARGI